MNKYTLCLLLIFLLTSCATKTDTCIDNDKMCIKALMAKHVTRKMSYWKKFANRPLNDRVFIAPEELVDYIDLDNRKNGFPNKPFIPKVPNKFIKDIINIFNTTNAIQQLKSTLFFISMLNFNG